jgi:RimJ/RimL family protein N-acetyltransferase
MTNEFLESLLINLNTDNDDSPEVLFQCRITDNVVFAKLWLKKPHHTDEIGHQSGAYNIYLIKNSEDNYVGVVLEMDKQDLHWFILESERGKGYLTSAMNNTILTHLSQSRSYQRISIDKNSPFFKASENVALKLGFIKKDENSYEIDCTRYRKPLITNNSYLSLEREKIESINKHINFLKNSLFFITSELEMIFNNNEDFDEFYEIAHEFDDLINKVNSTYEKYKNEDLY